MMNMQMRLLTRGLSFPAVSQVRWLRVVLDEAHAVKNHKSRTAQAAVALRAERRWAVTGTPLQVGHNAYWQPASYPPAFNTGRNRFACWHYY